MRMPEGTCPSTKPRCCQDSLPHINTGVFNRPAQREFLRQSGGQCAGNVHPVPCVWRVVIRVSLNSVNPSSSSRTSTSISPDKCPPFTRTAAPLISRKTRAACRMSSTDKRLMPVSFSASGRFGVSTVACGKSCVFRQDKASSARRLAPPFATITGSTTTGNPGIIWR